MYLVDTNVLSEARRGTTVARDWLRSVDPETIYLSVITLGEIMKGIELRQRTYPEPLARCGNGLSSFGKATPTEFCRSETRSHSNGAASPRSDRGRWQMR